MTHEDALLALREEHQDITDSVISAAIKAQVSQGINQIRRGESVSLNPEPVEKALKNVINVIFRQSFSLTMDTFGPGQKATFLLGEEDLLNYLLSVGLTKVKVINDTTRRLLLEEMLRGIEEGLDNYDIAQRMFDKWMAGAPHDGPISRFRTEIIARTEIAAASNAGSLSGATQAGMTHKRWSSVRDHRTRRPEMTGRQYDHYANWDASTGQGAHGQIRMIHEPFTISGEQLMFPGDPSLGASVGNLAMCRCAMTYEFRRQ